jgi:PAS domain S-box-containing protein
MKPRVVLVIEDNPVTQKLVRLTLGNDGFNVIEASDGAEALALVSRTPPDLILQDLLLPDMDGFELVSRLRGMRELDGVPIIAFSGFLSRLEYGRAAAAGFTDFLPKPVEPSRLLQTVRAHLPLDLTTPAKTGGGRRVLVVDDDPVQLKLARLRLAALDWAVTTATDGVEALEILKREGTDVVISDVLMPRLDGFGLCVAVRRDPGLSQLPVILVSSNYVEAADRELARSMGATAFVVRTPELTDFIRALDAAVSVPSDGPPQSIHPDPGEYQDRVRGQLERQAAMNAAFAHRSSMHASVLSVVAGISEALTLHRSIDGVLSDILGSLLEASGVSSGALFVRAAHATKSSFSVLDGIGLRAQVGFTTAASEELAGFFEHPEIFERAVATRAPVILGSALSDAAERDLLRRAAVESALLVPFVANRECLGLFLLGSKARDLTEGDWIPFARTMAAQIGQALALNRAFAELAASENRYRLLLESASDGIFTLDADGKFLDLNPAMERFLGRERAELIGASVFTLVAADDDEQLRRELGLSRELGSLRVEARRFTHPDGSVVLGDISATFIDAENGIVLGILRDVTERSRAEAEHRLLQSLALAASEAPDLVSALEIVLQKLCDMSDWTLGAAWIPEPEKGVLECAALWTRNQAERAGFQVLGEPVFAMGEGVLGRAWSTKAPVWVHELALERGCSRSHIAGALGVHAVLAVPVLASDEVVAVIEFFMLQARGKDAHFVSVVSASCAQLGAIMTRKREEAALRASEARFARLAESGIIGITTTDVNGTILESNDAYLHMVGYTREELERGAVRWADLTPPEFKERNDTAIQQLQEQGVAPPFETETFRKDGSRLPLLVASAMLEYPRCIAISTDISERKRAEKALLARAQVAALTGEVGMALTAGQTIGEILQRCCEAMVSHLGAAFARIWTLDPGSTVLELQASAGMYTHIDGAHALVPVGKLEIGLIAEERQPHLSNDVLNDPRLGDRDWARREGLSAFAGHPLLVRGEVVGVMAMFSREPLAEIALTGLASIADAIAVQIRGKAAERTNLALEAQLRQAQKMEAVGRLAGGVAHDFNNVLSVILSYAELIVGELQTGDPMRDDVDEIRKAGLRAADLTRQLLMFSRQQVMQPKVLDVDDVLRGMEKMLRRLLGADVELVLHSNPSPARVKMDPTGIEQIIMNLAVNARDAMPTGGRLTIETSNVDLGQHEVGEHSGATAGPHVMLAVSDTGVGMDVATQSRIFEPFFTTKAKDKGTGLGLSTAYGIVRQSAGTISVRSELGKGTTFDVHLPRVDAPLDGVLAPAAEMNVRGNETILLVEDEDAVRSVASSILRRQGYRVLVAQNAGEALLICETESESIHLLLTDVVMPQMSGPELGKRLAATRPEMKVLCMSGYTDDSIVRHGVLQAEISYLQKPITPQLLTRKVRQVLDASPS